MVFIFIAFTILFAALVFALIYISILLTRQNSRANIVVVQNFEEQEELLSQQKESMSPAKEWQEFYKNHFNLDTTFDDIKIPEHDEDGWRLVFIPAGLTCEHVFEHWKFPKLKHHDDLDEALAHNMRAPEKSYAVWVRESVEPDENHLGKSVQDIENEGVSGITLLERMILGTKHFHEKGKHLDIKGLTICSGSKYHGEEGYVPYVDHTQYGRILIGFLNKDHAYSKHGIREVKE